MRSHRLKKKMNEDEIKGGPGGLENSWSMAPHEDTLCSNYSRVTAAFVSQHWTDERLHASVRMEDNFSRRSLGYEATETLFPLLSVFVLFSWIRFALEINSKPGNVNMSTLIATAEPNSIEWGQKISGLSYLRLRSWPLCSGLW